MAALVRGRIDGRISAANRSRATAGAHHDGWNRGGAALGVIEHLDVIEHITAGFFARVP